jgi:RES domain-containing protein
MDRHLANAVANCDSVMVTGAFFRHASLRARPAAGSFAGGRWGPPGAFPVLYLGRPPESVTVEAYRHLVDPFPGMTATMVAPRRFWSYKVDVTQILDLRVSANLKLVGLTGEDLRGPHEPCQVVGAAAHQLSLHGVIAPAATGLGETLALFMKHLPDAEIPIVIKEQVWETLPVDPRKFRLIRGDAAEN